MSRSERVLRHLRLGEALDAFYLANRDEKPAADDGPVGWFVDVAIRQQTMDMLDSIYQVTGLDPPA